MSERPNPDLAIAAWLGDEASEGAPARLLAATRQQIESTRQSRSWWPARRFREMNTALRIAIAAAAVVALVVVGINVLPKQGGVGSGPTPSPTQTPTQTPSPSPTASPTVASNQNFTGSYAAGTTYAIDDPCCVATSGMTFTIPAAGWYAPLEAWRIGKNVTDGSDIFDLYVAPSFVSNVYTGGCHWRGTELDPAVGATVDDLATALIAQAGPGSSPPASVTVGGYAAKKVELLLPSGLDVTTCDSDGDQAIFGRFVSDNGFGAQPYTHGVGQHNTFYIVDVGGTRQVIDAMYLPNASAADRAELDEIVASIRFEPRPASLSPSP